MRQRVAIEGIDGVGKTTIAQELADSLAADGLTTSIHAPFRLANERLGEDIYPLWQSPRTAKVAIKILHSVLDDCEQQAQDTGTDVVIYDRHWMTVFTEIGGQPELVKAWGDYFVPAALLTADPATAAKRLANDTAASWSQLEAQQSYAGAYDGQIDTHFKHVLGIYRSDDDVSTAAITRAIASDLYIRR